ncbi:Glycine/D-amino acid oxidase, deaminating [Bosea sp. LC85]|uniref:NAD(P)/FAD-dependent oxidoreductase n=1 Tax=Bosea sp. LC85 TaxID=1502851 RepID=UPI0004E3D9A2|nr:FAD-binding oxidoreductase [Bosea sp. LC85]KFC70948.1 Glycine/D-amino acid oxidase, deaminating [Bosea sp. LC85]
MGITIETIDPDAGLPARSDVVIIGGGIIGITTALFLARDGISVTVCEKGEVGHEQSGRNWGWVRIMGRDPGEIPLGLESMRLWSEMDKLVGGDTGFTRSGIVYVADTPSALAQHEAWLDHARQYQLDSRLLSSREIATVLPGCKRSFAGALFTPSDARAEPQKAVPAMARALRRHGGTVLTRCAVRGIETKAGRVSAVVTERGTIACSQVVLAGGAWSRLFLGNLGIDFPQLKVLGSVLRTEPLDGPPPYAVGASDFAFRKRQDGGYTVAHRGASTAEIVPDSFRLFADFLPSLVKQRQELRLRLSRRFLDEARTPRGWGLDDVTPFERMRVLDPTPSAAILDEAKANLIKAFPAFAGMRIAQAWGGFIDATPDAVPVIGEVPRLPGFFIASGFSGHGFGIGPGAGRLVADLVRGATPMIDTKPFRLERFARLERTTRVA